MADSWSCETCGCSQRDARNRCRACLAREGREYAKRPEVKARVRVYKRAWRKANPEKVRAADRRRTYGITDAEIEKLLAAQVGRCRICRVSDADSVDHCHATGRIRAMLCRACNAGLGLFRDNPDLLRSASRYLQKL
jgi:hypothetical protein